MKIFDSNVFKVHFLEKFSKQHVIVKWNPDAVIFPDDMLQEVDLHWQALPKEKFFNGALVRLDDFDKDKELTVHLSPLNYKTLLYSNAHVHNIIQTWGEQYLAKVVGVSVVYESADHMLILMHRSMNVGEFPGHIDVFGGHIDVPQDSSKPDIFASMQQEIREEMNLDVQDHSLDLIALVESVPNRKPEFVFYAHSDLTHKQICSRIRLSKDQFEFTDVKSLARQDIAGFLETHKSEISPSAFASLCCFHELY